MIRPGSLIAYRQKRVALNTPGDPVPDADGGYVEVSAPLDPPRMFAHVTPAGRADIERIAGQTTLSTATHLVVLPFHVQVTTETTVHVEDYPRADRVLKVVYVGNPDERGATLELLCAEQVQ